MKPNLVIKTLTFIKNFVLVDKNKHIRKTHNRLNKSTTNQLITDVKTLKKSAMNITHHQSKSV